jgi:hypothetical protein
MLISDIEDFYQSGYQIFQLCTVLENLSRNLTQFEVHFVKISLVIWSDVTILVYCWGSLGEDMVYLLVFCYHLLGLLFEIVNNVVVANSLQAGVKITSLLSNKL